MEYSAQLIVPKIENPLGFDWLFHENPSENLLPDFPPVQTFFEPNYPLPFSYLYDQLPSIDFQNFEDIDGGFFFDNAFSYCEDPMVDEKPKTNLVTSFSHNNKNLTSDQIGFEVSRLIESEIFGSSEKNEEETRSCGRRKKKVVELELDDIQKYFDVPIKEAAKGLRVGVTRLKKRCRELNIMRWPHRKLKSLKYLLNNVKKMGLNSNEIMMLEEQQRLLEVAPDMDLTERAKKLRQACFKANYKSKRSLEAARA
ncbi:RWP-RK domain containing protein [Trema orientale]|uniref:RWP-RK domain containing protein n=1 Tax=Trema orientale TaxID=63057 RepID=A0A2P5E6T3_TREOI|nr:RWP-RK domain containing protein [Trema orientale]